MALEIGKHGHKIVVNYFSASSQPEAEAVVEEIKASGGDAIALECDSKYQISHMLYL